MCEDLKKEVERLTLLVEQLKTVPSMKGVYPMATVDKNGVETKRTEWQEGWNACVLDYDEKIFKVIEKIWPDEVKKDLMFLLLADVGWIDTDGHFLLNMNDTFAWACADCEEVPDDKISEVADFFKQYGYAGLTYWVAHQRKEYYSEFKDVRNDIKRIMKLEKKHGKSRKTQTQNT